MEKDLKNFILRWNRLYPIDYVWRKKYNIPFGSKAHREMDFIDMLLDFKEEDMVKNALYKLEHPEEDNLLSDENIPHTTAQEIDEAFDKLDINELNKKQDA